MFKIADLADRRIAVLKDQPNFTGRESEMSILSFFGNQLSIRSCRTSELAAFSQLQFDVMNQSPCRNISEREAIPRFDIGGRAGDHAIRHLQLRRSQDVSLLAIGIVEQSNPRRSIGVIFNGSDLGRDLSLVPFEIDHPISSLVATSLVPGRYSTIAVSPSRLFQRDEKALFRHRGRDLIIGQTRLMPYPW